MPSRKRARVGRRQQQAEDSEEDSEEEADSGSEVEVLEEEEAIYVHVQSRCSLPLHAQPVPYLTVCAHICVK